MCVKLPPGDLNPGPCSPHPTNIYTCGVTTTPKVRNGDADVVQSVAKINVTFQLLRLCLVSKMLDCKICANVSDISFATMKVIYPCWSN